jgi:hypothetical protein
MFRPRHAAALTIAATITLTACTTQVAGECLGGEPASTPRPADGVQGTLSMTTPAVTEWEGPQFRIDGCVDATGFNAFLETKPELVQDPAEVALLLFDTQRSEVEVSETVNDGQTTVALLIDTSKVDDSVASRELRATLIAAGETWKVVDARWAQSCQSGRGHANYSVEPCG